MQRNIVKKHDPKRHGAAKKKMGLLMIPVIIGVVVLLALSVFWATGFWEENAEKSLIEANLLDFGFVADTDGEAGQTTGTSLHYNANLAAGMRYPKFANDTLDELTRAEMAAILDQFKQDTAGYVAPSSEERAMLTVDYEIVFFGEQTASVRYHIKTKTYGVLSDALQIRTTLYDLVDLRLIPAQELFHEQGLSFLSTHAIEENISNTGDLSFEQRDVMEASLSPSWDNFEQVFFPTADTMQVLLADANAWNQVGLQLPDNLLLTLSLDDLFPYLQQNITQFPNPNNVPFNDPPPDLELRKKQLLQRIDPDKPVVALTYDDGPYPPVTQGLLDELEKVNGRATFFVTGERAKLYPDTIKRASEMNCQIANHSYDHPSLVKLSEEKIQKQLESTTEAIQAAVTEQLPMMLRPPYGSYNQRVKDVAGMPLILWSIDSMDWKSRNANAVISEVLPHVRDGDIVLMHDLYESTYEASKTIISELTARGFQLVTVEELLLYRSGEYDQTAVYHSARP